MSAKSAARRLFANGRVAAGDEADVRKKRRRRLFANLTIAVVAVAVLALAALTALLRLDAECGHGARLEALDADFLAGLQTITVGAVLDAFDGLVDLANELALAIPRTQLQAEFLFLGRTVVGIGKIGR